MARSNLVGHGSGKRFAACLEPSQMVGNFGPVCYPHELVAFSGGDCASPTVQTPCMDVSPLYGAPTARGFPAAPSARARTPWPSISRSCSRLYIYVVKNALVCTIRISIVKHALLYTTVHTDPYIHFIHVVPNALIYTFLPNSAARTPRPSTTACSRRTCGGESVLTARVAGGSGAAERTGKRLGGGYR